MISEYEGKKDTLFSKNYNYVSRESSTWIFVYPRRAFAFAISPCLVTQQTVNWHANAVIKVVSHSGWHLE